MNIQRLIKLGIINDKFENLSKSEQITLSILSVLTIGKGVHETYLNYYDENNNVLLTYEVDNKLLLVHFDFIECFMNIKNDNSSLSDDMTLIQHSLLHVFNSRLGFNLEVYI